MSQNDVISRDLVVENGHRVQVHISDLGDAVGFYDANFNPAPDAELPAALTNALEQLLNEEVAAKGALFVYGKNGTQYINVPSLPNHYKVRLVVSQGLQWAVTVENFVHNISCPGQPGWYEAPAWIKTTALALALIETVKRQHAGTAPEVLKLWDELKDDAVPAPAAE
jgi:hypothetical protein